MEFKVDLYPNPSLRKSDINRNTVEFKGCKFSCSCHVITHINRNTVEFKAAIFITVSSLSSYINRNTVEFKGPSGDLCIQDLVNINRNTVEFKVDKYSRAYNSNIILIETQWNLKLIT